MRSTAIYPGTFDPLTVGHVDVARRASSMFDDLIVAVAASTAKGPYFTLEERIDMATMILGDLDNVTVQSFDSLLMDFAQKVGSRVIVRGLRAISDFESEVQIAGVNRHLAPDVETIFIAASQKYTFMSSSIVREIAKMNGDISEFVHPAVIAAFEKKHKDR